MLFLEKLEDIAIHMKNYCPKSVLKSQKTIIAILGSKIENVKPSIAISNMILRSSRSQVFFKIGVFKNFGKFTGKHLVPGSLF